MATVTKPMALDESIHTTDGNDTNIADLMQSGLASIAMAIGSMPALDAANITYDNSTSGLAATYVGTAIDELASEKADAATTLAGYGITDAYTQTETDNLLSAKQDTLTAGTGIDITGNTISVDATAEEITFDDTHAGLGINNTQDAIDALNDNLTDSWASENVLGAKNLLPYPYQQTTKTTNGITFTDNGDGTITANGTASANASFFMYARLTSTLSLTAGDYIFSGCPQGGSTSTYRMLINHTEGGSGVVDGYDTGDGAEISYESDTTIGFNIDVMSGTTVNNLVFKPMIRPASVKDSTYAPYTMTNKELTDAVKCNQTTAGTYTLQATVNANGNVTYSWV